MALSFVSLIPFRILPILALLFLCSFLDRTNVGNAKILGLEEDLQITNHQYDIGLTVYYLFYILRCVHLKQPCKVPLTADMLCQQRGSKQLGHQKGFTEDMATSTHCGLGYHYHVSGIRA